MASHEQKEMSTKVKLSKLHCPFTWKIQSSVIKHSIMYINNNNVDCETDVTDDEASCSLELLMKYLFKCYKAVLSADNDKAKEIIAEAENILMQIQQGYDIYLFVNILKLFVFFITIILRIIVGKNYLEQ